MALRQTQKQSQVLFPQMIESMNLLQMGIQELREYLENALQENPVLELPEPGESSAPEEELSQQLDWLRAYDTQNAQYYVQDAEDAHGDTLACAGYYLDEESDLKRYILSQFLGTQLEPDVMRAVEFLVSRLDSDGLLEEELPALSQMSGFPPRIMERAMIELQAADPAGIGARNLSERLRLQLERRAGDHRLAISIAENHLDRLARNQYGAMSRILNASERDVREACRLIRSLKPRLGVGFAVRENLLYITPDLWVTAFPDHFELSFNDVSLPQLTLSSYYIDLLKETEDPAVRNYLTEKVEAAKCVIRSVSLRRSTLLRCAQWVVERQESFFRLGAKGLRPLTMKEAAQALELHESTVSRAVKDKYLQCNRGVYPLSYFFSRPVGGEAASPEAVKQSLRELIQKESSPLSDQKLCHALSRQGYLISRRTVAKYREELGIPNASGRKK